MTRLADVQFLLLACTIRLGNRSSYNDLNLTRVYPSNAQPPTPRPHLQPPIILIRSSSYDSPRTPIPRREPHLTAPPHSSSTASPAAAPATSTSPPQNSASPSSAASASPLAPPSPAPRPQHRSPHFPPVPAASPSPRPLVPWIVPAFPCHESFCWRRAGLLAGRIWR